MIAYNQKENQLKIKIPISGTQGLCDYKNGILRVLNKIEIHDCSPELMFNLKSVYELLEDLELHKRLLYQQKNLCT